MTVQPHTIFRVSDDVFGYNATFKRELTKIGQISDRDFTAGYKTPTNYLRGIGFDPTTAKFWDEFDRHPQTFKFNHKTQHGRLDDFRLNEKELVVFKQNGFVVSERLGTSSFAEQFYRIFRNDLPVFISTDAILHAWHHSFDLMLEELEETYLAYLLNDILTGMAEQLPAAWQTYGSNVLSSSLLDVDYFLCIARTLLTSETDFSKENYHNWICPDLRSLWHEKSKPPYQICLIAPVENERIFFETKTSYALAHFTGEWTVQQIQDRCQQHLGGKISSDPVYKVLKQLAAYQIIKFPLKSVPTYLKQERRVEETLEAIAAEEIQQFNLFGRQRWLDFSLFKPRGHYTNESLLKRYFKAMIWCGTIEFQIAGDTPSPQELGAAIVLYDLLKRSGKFEQWQQFDRIIQTFVGRSDSMNFAQLGEVLTQAEIQSPADIKNLETLETLQAGILAGNFGSQSYSNQFYETVQLPRTFAVLGQRFVLDSWALSKVVAPEIEWDGNRLERQIPSCLDMAFVVLGNNQIVPDLVGRMTNKAGHPLRDGFLYPHNLAATRNTVDEQNSSIWTENIYMAWLATLRELSVPTTDTQYPEPMRTRAWAMKTLNTQLASWTQLRHDTILYAKPSVMYCICEYPAGFVEPRIQFWERFEQMVLLAANSIEQTPFPDSSIELEVSVGDNCGKSQYQLNLKEVQQQQSKFCRHFAQILSTLKVIATKQLAQQPLESTETQFLRDLIEAEEIYGGVKYSGWYPSLFYANGQQSAKEVAIATDIHTGINSVLQEAIGQVDLLMIAVDNGTERMVYAGPVLSHYEFESKGISRLSDAEWQAKVSSGNLPPRPEWTQNYLASANVE